MSWIDYWRDQYARDFISLRAFELIAEDALKYGYAEKPKSFIYMTPLDIPGLPEALQAPDEEPLN